MEDHDDWKLGDESDPVSCPRCGKRNRAGLSYCTICGSPFAEEREEDPGSLRTIGEAMGARRKRRGPERRPLRAWTIAAGLLLTAVVGLTWLQTREDPYLLEDWLAPAPATATATATPTPPPPAPTEAPTRVAPTKRPTPVATETEPPPEPTAVWTEVPTPRRTPTRPRQTAKPPAPRRPPVAVPPAPVVPADEGDPQVERPRSEATERPSLGTDLQEATQAYRQAVELHNRRVDEYNALADEIQRRNAWDDSEGSVELRRRLDRSRAAVESARVQAEMLRARMESVRGKYR